MIFKVLFCGILLVSAQFAISQEKPVVAEFSKDKVIAKKHDTVEMIPVIPTIADTSGQKPYRIELTYVGAYYQSARLVITLTNRSGKFIDHFWLQASLLDKRKSFLYRGEPLLFTKVKAGKSVSAEMLCESINTEDIGYVVLSPMLLEVDDEEQVFDIDKVEIMPDNEHGILVVFESRVP
jgi:hypothetical protein